MGNNPITIDLRKTLSKASPERRYLIAINGFFQLSKTELDVMEQLLKHYHSLTGSYKGDTIWRLLFSRQIKEEIKTVLGKSVPHINNVVTAIQRKKGVIFEDKVTGLLQIHRLYTAKSDKLIFVYG